MNEINCNKEILKMNENQNKIKIINTFLKIICLIIINNIYKNKKRIRLSI